MRSAATSEPLPGSSPRSDGSVLSMLVATHTAPARIARPASARSAQPIDGEYPCTTATGPSSKLRTGRNEIYALAAPLAARLGHDRLWLTDDHTADALTAGAGKDFEAAMMQIWDNPGARALRPQMEAQAKTMTDAAGVLAYYRRANSTTALRQQLDVDFLAALKDKSPQHWGRRYVAWWEVRNLRMVAAIRAAGGAQPGSRVLSIVGGSHKPYFERYLAQSHDATVVDVLGLLK